MLDVLEILLGPQQRLVFNVLLYFIARHPVDDFGRDQSAAAALEEVSDVLEEASREGTVAGVVYEMRVTATVHSFVRCHPQTRDLESGGNFNHDRNFYT